MGHTESKERGLFIDITKHMLHKRGVNVSGRQLRDFFHFVQECAPWFPEEGSVNPETWQRLGQDMKTYYTLHGPEKVPVDAFPLWNVLKDSFDPTHEVACLAKQATPEEKQPLCAAVKIATCENLAPSAPPPALDEHEKSESESDSDSDNEQPEKKEEVPPDYQAELEEEAARYHSEDFDPLALAALRDRKVKVKIKSIQSRQAKRLPEKVGFLGAMREARRQGETLSCFPVIFPMTPQDPPQWEPLPFKLIKEIKTAVKDFGPTSPYTLQLVDSIAAEWMTPYDWQQTAKSCLNSGLSQGAQYKGWSPGAWSPPSQF